MSDECDVLILGGSFAGLELVYRLRRSRVGRTLRIAVLDRQHSHPYIPLGHELLTRRIPTSVEAETILPSRAYVESRGPSLRFIAGELASFDPATRTALLDDGRSMRARFVVFALGSEVRAPSALRGAERLLAYKSVSDFERAQRELDRTPQGTALVVGGGITGVEIAGELAHGTRLDVTLIHGGARLLPGLCERAGKKALSALEAQGVNVRLDTRLLEFDETNAVLESGGVEQTLPCSLGFWAGGIQPPPVLQKLGVRLDAHGWVAVDPSLRCGENLFAGGDLARIYDTPHETLPWPTMNRAVEAMFAATTIATNIVAQIEGKALARHRLWTDFPHGVSIGARSLLVYGAYVLDAARFTTWFRRFLMKQYMRRYPLRVQKSA